MTGIGGSREPSDRFRDERLSTILNSLSAATQIKHTRRELRIAPSSAPKPAKEHDHPISDRVCAAMCKSAWGRKDWRHDRDLRLPLLAGCGGNPGKQASGVGDEFASKALAVCEAALEDKHGWQPFPVVDFDPSDPDASKFPEISTWLAQQVAPTFHMWLSGLQALGTPPTALEEWNAVLATVEKIDQLNGDQITAANERDAGAFAAATSALESTQDELVAASDKAGVADCADVHAA